MDWLEKRVLQLESDVGDIKVAVGRLDEKLSSMEEKIEARFLAQDEKLTLMATRSAAKEDMINLRVEMHSLLRQHIMWNVGSIIAVAGVVVAILSVMR